LPCSSAISIFANRRANHRANDCIVGGPSSCVKQRSAPAARRSACTQGLQASCQPDKQVEISRVYARVLAEGSRLEHDGIHLEARSRRTSSICNRLQRNRLAFSGIHPAVPIRIEESHLTMITLTVNGVRHTLDVDPSTPLLYTLRNHLEFNCPKLGCG